MKKNSKKLLSALLAMVMVLCSLPLAGVTFNASAEDGEYTEGYYTYTVENGEATITGCDNSISGDVVIPDTLGGYPVTSIGYEAFYNCTGLTSITIPDGVTSIGHSAFSNCIGLTDIKLPKSLSKIDKSSFECSNLHEISIPEGVEIIAQQAFQYCENLKSVYIPSSVTSMSGSVFKGCSSLESLVVSPENSFYRSVDNCIIEIKTKTLIVGCAESIIPSDGSVTRIAGAFDSRYKMTDMVIPDTIEEISSNSFKECYALTSITIPNSVTFLGGFPGCVGLTNITIPDSVITIGSYAFCWCRGLKNVTIGKNVESIENFAFYDCPDLTSVTIPKSVTNIEDHAFGYFEYYGEQAIETKKIPNFTIYGYTGTAAETYANENGFTFVALDEEHTHTYSDWVVTTESTCTAEGEETRTCSVCGATENRPVEKKAHDLFRVEEASTCKVQGVSYDVCDSCGNTFNYTVLPLAPHTFGEWAVTTEPTCTAEGEETRTCSVCGAEETRPVEKKAHDLFRVEEASTCTVAGVSYDVCDSCGNTFNYTVLPLAPHTFGEWAVTTEPTCTAEGEETRTCSVCGATETRPVEKKAHTFGDWVTTKEATVFESGERKRTCTACGFEETEEIEKLEAKETKDENTGISVVYPDSSYEGEVEISVTQTFDGASYHVLNAEKGNYQKALFDITTLVDGNKVQPNGSVFVKIPLPDGYNAEKTVVYYITNDGRLEKMDSRVEDGYIVFETTHFSFYAIVDETEKQPENPSENCSCACHKGGIAKLFFKIKLFFQKIFKKNKVCSCGVAHY